MSGDDERFLVADNAGVFEDAPTYQKPCTYRSWNGDFGVRYQTTNFLRERVWLRHVPTKLASLPVVTSEGIFSVRNSAGVSRFLSRVLSRVLAGFLFFLAGFLQGSSGQDSSEFLPWHFAGFWKNHSVCSEGRGIFLSEFLLCLSDVFSVFLVSLLRDYLGYLARSLGGLRTSVARSLVGKIPPVAGFGVRGEQSADE